MPALKASDLARGRETVGEVGASSTRYSEVLAERYADTEVHGYADVVETVAIFRDVLEAFLAERHPRGEVDARGEPDFGSKAGAEAQADLRFGGWHLLTLWTPLAKFAPTSIRGWTSV